MKKLSNSTINLIQKSYVSHTRCIYKGRNPTVLVQVFIKKRFEIQEVFVGYFLENSKITTIFFYKRANSTYYEFAANLKFAEVFMTFQKL